MKLLTEVKIPREAYEVQLSGLIFRSKRRTLHLLIQTNRARIPQGPLVELQASDLADAVERANGLLQIVRGIFEQTEGRKVKFFGEMAGKEAEIPHFIEFWWNLSLKIRMLVVTKHEGAMARDQVQKLFHRPLRSFIWCHLLR
jgi:hypothetical protein